MLSNPKNPLRIRGKLNEQLPESTSQSHLRYDNQVLIAAMQVGHCGRILAGNIRMYQWQPLSWLKVATVGAGLPWVAASLFNTSALVTDITTRAQAAAGDWAKVQLNGRDATLTGTATGQDAVDAAVKAVMGTYGVRTVIADDVKIAQAAPAAVMAAPTVTSITTNQKAPVITGTWPEGVAKTLDVAVNGKTYSLGKDAELTSSAGTWTLKPAGLADGAYDVVPTVGDGASQKVATATPGKLVIDTVAPAAGVAAPATAGAAWPFALKGTWPEGDATTLTAQLADKTYTLGKDKELTSDGKGNFTFDPRVDLKPGSYDVNFASIDAAGNSTPFVAKAAIVIAEAAKPMVPALAAPTVAAVPAGTVWPYAISGTWPEAKGNSLSVTLADKTYDLGKTKELISDGHGTYTFLPSATLKPGSYDLIYLVTAADGSTTKTVVPAAIVVADAPAAAAPAALTAPTVDHVSVEAGQPAIITGTWKVGEGSTLNVAVNGTNYQLGKQTNLLSDTSGKWTLKLADGLPEGKYNIRVVVAASGGRVVGDGGTDELTITPVVVAASKPAAPAAAPKVSALAAPTVVSGASDSDHPTVKGTWPAGIAKGLTVELDGVTHTLGKDFDLLSDASGNWTLKPKAPVVNGTYNVIATAIGADGKGVSDTTKGELTVKVAAPQPAPPASQTYDCVGTLARISAVFPVRFAFDREGLKSPFDMAVNQYAALLKDPRCMSIKMQVAGHADYYGSEAFNQGLSERRAQTVIDALVKAGIDKTRLNGIGFSKDKPLDPARSADARAKNRRVEFTVMK